MSQPNRPCDSSSTGLPCSSWQLRTRTLHFKRLPVLMGIVNVTPDSFSDGGKFLAPESAVQQAVRLVEQGAEMIDVGGESTRPYSQPVEVDEELRRVIPVVEAICQHIQIPVSIDTSKAAVAAAAIKAGAEVINDVTGLERDAGMVDVARQTGAGVCVMHMQGNPQTMQDAPSYQDVCREVLDYLRQRRDDLVNRGIPRKKICLDPGIGFGKTREHNLQLLKACDQLHTLGCPILVGHSRKGFIRKVLQQEQCHPVAGTVGVALALARQRVQVIRVHDVEPVREALVLFDASGGIGP